MASDNTVSLAAYKETLTKTKLLSSGSTHLSLLDSLSGNVTDVLKFSFSTFFKTNKEMQFVNSFIKDCDIKNRNIFLKVGKHYLIYILTLIHPNSEVVITTSKLQLTTVNEE